MVAGVEVDGDVIGESDAKVLVEACEVVEGGLQQRESWRLVPAITQPRGIPARSTIGARLVPCLPRSTGDLPAASPPQGALTRQPSTLRSDRSRPTIWS